MGPGCRADVSGRISKVSPIAVLKDERRQEVQAQGFSSPFGALLKNCTRHPDGVERWAGAEEAPCFGCMDSGPPSGLGEGNLNSPSIIWRKPSL